MNALTSSRPGSRHVPTPSTSRPSRTGAVIILTAAAAGLLADELELAHDQSVEHLVTRETEASDSHRPDRHAAGIGGARLASISRQNVRRSPLEPSAVNRLLDQICSSSGTHQDDSG